MKNWDCTLKVKIILADTYYEYILVLLSQILKKHITINI